MKNFNFLRFRNTLLWQIVDHKRIIINFAAFGLLFVLIPMVFNIAIHFHHIMPMDWNDVGGIFAGLMIAYLVSCGAFIVSNISNKNNRINAFLLPASKLEKFVSRYIFLLLAVPIAAFIGLAVGDVIQMPIFKILSGDASSVTYSFLNSFAHSYDFWYGLSDSTEDLYAFFMCVFCLHSIYLLLGTIFRRHAWIKGNVSLLVALIVITSAVLLIGKAILDAIYGAGNYAVYMIDSTFLSVLSDVIVIALFVFNYWAAYRIYNRMQAVNNKWYNF